MSDNEIRKILAERKRAEDRAEMLRDYIEGFVGFACLLATCFMLSGIGV